MTTSTDPYRLSRTAVPLAYRLVVEPDLEGGVFRGSVEIDIELTVATNCIELNAQDLVILCATLDESLELRSEIDRDTERLRLHASTELAPGPHCVRIDYSGIVSDSLYGFYRVQYEGTDGPEFMGVTQFEAPYARQAFPCWDEPDRKATFDISIICPAGLTAISNGAETARTRLSDDRVRFDFSTTIAMSTYLVAWIVGRFETSEPVLSNGVPIRVVHRTGQSHLAHFALEVAAHGLDWFERYYGIPYPGDKLDLIAIPDFAFGAMENLGCITFREILLLIDPQRASRSELEQAAMVIDHEIAHMWFGDLVTMDWWDGLWLNEAFATLMETMCPADLRPDWHLWTSFAAATCLAFETDALGATRAIEHPVESPADIEGMFDVLTYEKGAAVLRMLEQWAGAEAFRSGVSTYLHRHRLANTSADDLWNALSEATSAPVGPMMSSWIQQGGHPVITVSRTSRGVHLRQQRQLLDTGIDHSDDRLWQVPIRIRAKTGNRLVEQTLVLDAIDVDVDLGGSVDWVDANVSAAGFYRVHYKGGLDPLGPGPGSLDPVERVMAVDNQFALFMAGVVELRAVIDLVRRIAADESNPQVWKRIAGVIDGLFVVSPPTHHDLLRVLVTELIGDGWARWESHRRMSSDPTGVADAAATAATLLHLGGLQSNSPAWSDIADQLVAEWDHDPASVHPELVGPALEVVAAHGDAEDFDAMVQRWRDAASPQDDQRVQAGLAQFRTVELSQRFWQMCLTDLRHQDVGRGVRSALANRATGTAAWDFVESKWDELTSRVPSGSHAAMVGGIRTFSDPALIARVRSFFETHPIPQGHQTLAQHLERLDVNLAARRRIEAELRGPA